MNTTKYKNELVGFYAQMKFTHALTLSWNSDSGVARFVSAGEARADIGKLLARVDRRLLGTRFHKKPLDRTRAVFFLEHVGRNIHAHGMLKIKKDNLLQFHKLFQNERGGEWNNIVRSGTYKLNIITDEFVTAGYLLKEQHVNSDASTTVWWDEFIPRTD